MWKTQISVFVFTFRPFIIPRRQGCRWAEPDPPGTCVWRSTTTTLCSYLVRTERIPEMG